MKKKLLFTLVLASMFIFLLAFAVSAATPEQYIEFGARFPGSDEYITVYTQNAENGQQRINFASYKFYSDVEFTEEVDMSTATGIDFSVAKTHGCGDRPISRMTRPSSPFVNCVEVKWLSDGMTSCGSQFFKGWTGLKSFDFGNMTDISDNAFENCGLESLTIPSTVTSIGSNSFAKSLSLTSVKFEGNPSIHQYGATFSGCTKLESVDLGPLTTLGSSMFKNCTSLTSVEIPSTLTTIGSYAFQSSGITEITIPSTVTKLDWGAFNSCKALESVTFEGGTITIAGDSFTSSSSLATLTFADDISGTIASSAFAKTGITSLIIPSGITSIGDSSFLQCTSLETVVFKGDDITLGNSVFSSCTKLTSVTLPKNITKIPNSTFWGCGKLVITNVNELTSLTTIGEDAFRDSATLVFTLPDSVTTIEARAFQSAFKNRGSITINPTSKLQTIGESAFNDSRAMTSIYIPSSVTSIGTEAFRQCYALTTLENFENCQITVLDANVFQSASKITSIKLPQTVTTINGAFSGNEKLALVYIPASVTTIADTFTGSQPANAVYIYTGKDASALSACTRLAGANVIDGNDYDPTTTYTGVNLVVGYSHCVVYNDGVHSDTELTALLESYYEAIDVVSKCTICEVTEIAYTIPALFTYRGYSVAEEGASGIDISYKVNREAIATYEGVTGEKVTYGIFAGLKDTIGANDIFGSDGKALTGVVTADMTDTDYSIFAIKMVGFSEAQMETVFAMGAYVGTSKNDTTNYTYLQISTPKDSEKYYFASYSDVLKLKNGN